MTKKTARKWRRRTHVWKIAKLCKAIIKTLDDWYDRLHYMLLVDGVHCHITEPRPFSTEWLSHKCGGKPAVNYELGVLLHKSQLTWIYGPTCPG